MKNKIISKHKFKTFNRNLNIDFSNQETITSKKKLSKRIRQLTSQIVEKIISLIILFALWVQVPQWDDDWSKCAVDVPDASCHWYIKSPDNTYGNGFDWKNAPWFDANGLNDIPRIEKETVIEKLQKQ